MISSTTSVYFLMSSINLETLYLNFDLKKLKKKIDAQNIHTKIEVIPACVIKWKFKSYTSKSTLL